MVSRTTTTAARATVSRPRYDRPGAEWSWSRTWTTTARKPPTARIGHHQRPTERAAWRERGPGSTSGAQAGACQPGGGWPQPMRGFTSLLLQVGSVGGGRRIRPRVGPGSRRHTGARRWATWSGRPAPAEGDDGLAEVAAGGAVGAGLRPAVDGDAAGHAADRPGAVTHVDQPGGASGHNEAPSRTADGRGLEPVGQGLDQRVDQRRVEAAVATEGAPVLQAALAGPASDGLGRHMQPGCGLAGPQPGPGCRHEFTSFRGSGAGRGHAALPGGSSSDVR